MSRMRRFFKKLPGVRRAYNTIGALGYRRTRRKRRNSSGKAKVMVTGDLGFLGSGIAEFLSEEYDVIGFDLQASVRENLKKRRLLKRRMAGCEYVVHAAAIPHPKKGSFDDYFAVNVLGSLNVMRAAATVGIRRIIYLSSVGYYGCNIEGVLKPAYFPIDESHPIASVDGRSSGKLDAYNQSKVMAEQILVWYGTNRKFEAVSLRVAPANSKAKQYPEEGSWRSDPRYRRRAFWTNCHPDWVPRAVKCAIEAPHQMWFEAFNVTDKYSPSCVDIVAFLRQEYPAVPVKCDLSVSPSLITPEKAEKLLGFQPCEER